MLSIKPINFYLKDIFLYNAADQGSWNPWGLSSNKFSQKVLKFLIKLNNKLNLDIYADVYSNGTVLITPPSLITIGCKLNLGDFPFDEKNCTMEFARYLLILKLN